MTDANGKPYTMNAVVRLTPFHESFALDES